MFETVLVANRGEIARRVIRTLRRLGIRSVVVHTRPDADAPHVRDADTAVEIGGYLDIQAILDAAARTGAEAVHPGYGFLAENAGFARACAAAGLVFIGPPAEAIELMGDKIHAKAAVSEAGVPVVPGSEGDRLTDDQLAAAARDIGMPVLLKPSAGGGGKGMRLVRDESALAEEIAAARREARASFGNDTLLVERWIDRPRHIEIQVLADAHGRIVHLGERECSLQRRHQKLIEEAPSALLDPETRAAMGQAAVRAAAACGYTGAGTVEFIVPTADPSSYSFMEMNTRLQVEHPVTELAASIDGLPGASGPTSLDLVEQQLRVAAGEPLAFTQSDFSFSGHAVEARICAEDPARDFLPTGGTVLLLDEPSGPLDRTGVRVDSGLAAGTEVGSSYDPMLAKVIARGPDRESALRLLRGALAGTRILGVTTNAGYLRRLLHHPEVRSGDLDTGLVERHPELTVPPAADTRDALSVAALVRQLTLAPAADPRTGWQDPFARPSGWRLGAEPAWTRHRLVPRSGPDAGGEPVEIRIRPASATTLTDAADNATDQGSVHTFEVRHGENPPVVVRLCQDADNAVGRRLLITLDGLTTAWTTATAPDGTVWLSARGETWSFAPHDPLAELALAGPAAAHGGALNAPMPGTVTLVKVAEGDRVTQGQPLLVLEAMKMEHVIAAPHDGLVERLKARPGATVAMDELLAVVAAEPPAHPATEPVEEQP
ncbi:acetyl/propionyl/methylcrotonyl-CoA carboxylase subunit alpha [Phaeacidiphilus oryzae]|uniref:acetyl/propionyl/methylcrotonyl-CoA carboxylase subunit alpha n=1 Tax=Phaeacidiphilus oryzae TaxID=348818 RepID=UPI00068E21CB|nr:biotin carboxylase N-terminal domain-containing protein [Phaeacidiphilus oryzae]